MSLFSAVFYFLRCGINGLRYLDCFSTDRFVSSPRRSECHRVGISVGTVEHGFLGRPHTPTINKLTDKNQILQGGRLARRGGVDKKLSDRLKVKSNEHV